MERAPRSSQVRFRGAGGGARSPAEPRTDVELERTLPASAEGMADLAATDEVVSVGALCAAMSPIGNAGKVSERCTTAVDPGEGFVNE